MLLNLETVSVQRQINNNLRRHEVHIYARENYHVLTFALELAVFSTSEARSQH